MYTFTYVLSMLNVILPAIGIHDYDNRNALFFIQNGSNCAVISEIMNFLPVLRNQDICEWYIQPQPFYFHSISNKIMVTLEIYSFLI